jgi:hypothetical protein
MSCLRHSQATECLTPRRGRIGMPGCSGAGSWSADNRTQREGGSTTVRVCPRRY